MTTLSYTDRASGLLWYQFINVLLRLSKKDFWFTYTVVTVPMGEAGISFLSLKALIIDGIPPDQLQAPDRQLSICVENPWLTFKFVARSTVKNLNISLISWLLFVFSVWLHFSSDSCATSCVCVCVLSY